MPAHPVDPYVFMVSMPLNQSILKKSLLDLAPYCRQVFFFGFFTNFMVLAPSWYMLQVYDRVIFSRNTTTLVMLTCFVVFLYLVMESLEWVRRRMMYQASLQFEDELHQKVFNAAFQARLKSAGFPIQQVFSDFKMLKDSLASSAFMSLVDIPYVLIFVVAIFLIHPALGYLTLGGLVLQVMIAVFNHYRVQPRMLQANQFALEAQTYFTSAGKKAEVVQAMGMLNSLHARWLKKQQSFLLHQAQASEIAGKNAAASKLLQVMQASLVLGLGCYLVINNSMGFGAVGMIIASILAAKVLSPFIQIIGQWRTLVNAQDAYARLEKLFDSFPAQEESMALPAPSGQVSVDNLSFAVAEPGSTSASNRSPFLRNIQFQLNPGEVLLVAGPSASGKSTLARLACGLLAPSSGKVRFDGVDAYQWNKEELGEYIGYLPQSIELLDGTIAENITRFGPVDEDKLITVIELLNLQDFIASLPEGLNTQIGSEGQFMSGGRRQLIGLARAIYGAPKIVILDEPNANLDTAGELALQNMVGTLKLQGTTFIIISHLQSIKAIADLMLVLMYGQVYRYGKPDDVIASMQAPVAQPGKSVAPLPDAMASAA